MDRIYKDLDTSPRVLVIDGHHETRESLCLLLEQWGYAVEATGDGPEAFAVAQVFQPDIVLMDLPGMDGCETARRLRRLRGLSQTEFLAMSADEQGSDAREVGFRCRLAKPIDPRLLRIALSGTPILEAV